MNNETNTWRQGRFIDNIRYKAWSKKDKEDANCKELLLVRPSPTGNAICTAVEPEVAEWIADRLNFAANIHKEIEDILVHTVSPKEKIEEIKKILEDNSYPSPLAR